MKITERISTVSAVSTVTIEVNSINAVDKFFIAQWYTGRSS